LSLLRLSGSARAALGTLALALWVASPTGLRAQVDIPNELATVERVRFEGRRKVPAKTLRAAIKTRSARLLGGDRPLLRADFLRADTLAIRDVYRQHGFLDAHVDVVVASAKEPGTVQVTFQIEEGARTKFGNITFSGVTVMPHDQLRRRLHSRNGRVFNPYFLKADATRIVAAYHDRGHFPEVTATNTRQGQEMHVDFAVDEGPIYHFGPVTLRPTDSLGVTEHFVRRELVIKPGEVYRSSRVELSVERLYETNVFRQVQMIPHVDSIGTVVPFDLRLARRQPRWIDAGIGSGTAERLQGAVQWGHRNIGARGMQGVLEGRLALDADGKFQRARISGSLAEPWLFATRTRGLVTLYLEEQHDRSDPRVLLETESKGVTFELRRQLGRYTRLALIQDNAFVIQAYTFRDPNLDPALRDSLIADVIPSYKTHRLALALSRDSRDDLIRMSRGSYQTLAAEIASGPAREAYFAKEQLVSSWYTPQRSGRWVLATRVRAGVIQPFGERVQFSPQPELDPEVERIPQVDRFRLGGVNTIRGYDENEIAPLGGLLLLQANAELRVSVWGPFGIEVYIDAGNVWARPSDIQDAHVFPDPGGNLYGVNDVRWAAGIGPQLMLPFGPLRMDFTWWPQPDMVVDDNQVRRRHARGSWQFAIGPSF
jgi:outer membrane protein insertion porin family